MAAEIVLHGTELSGHTHRVELLLRMLGLRYRFVVTPAAARVQRWLSIAAGEVMYGPAIARMVSQWDFPGDLQRAKQIAAALLRFMDDHLNGRRFLAAEHPTIADLACYSYVAHAPEGGIPLDGCGSVIAWLRRVEALPHFKPIPPSPIPPQA